MLSNRRVEDAAFFAASRELKRQKESSDDCKFTSLRDIVRAALQAAEQERQEGWRPIGWAQADW